MLSKIQNVYNTLTRSGQKIADFILKNPNEVTKMSIQKCARMSDVSPSAVIRFCQDIGAEGFAQLKLEITKELTATISRDDLPTIKAGDPANIVFPKVFQSGIHTLEDTLRLIDFFEIEQICDIFLNAKRIFFFAVGTSSVIATDAHYRFAQLGFSAYSNSDIVFMNVSAANLEPGDVAVGISHSGMSKSTISAIRHAKAAGAKTVAITSFKNSILANECDFAVVAFSDEQNYPVEAVSARIAHICIIDAFMMTLASKKYNGLTDHIKRRNAILKDIRY